MIFNKQRKLCKIIRQEYKQKASKTIVDELYNRATANWAIGHDRWKSLAIKDETLDTISMFNKKQQYKNALSQKEIITFAHKLYKLVMEKIKVSEANIKKNGVVL